MTISTSGLVQGVLWMSLSALTVALVSAMAKSLEHAQSSQILFFQMLVSTIVFGAFLLPRGRGALATRRRALHLARGLVGFASWYVFFVAIDDIPLMDGTLLSNTVPLWVPLIVWVWTQVRPSGRLWGGIVLGTIGVALVMHPSRGPEVHFGTVLALASGVLGAVGFVAAGMLGRTDPALLIAFTYSLVSLVLATPYALVEWQTPDPATTLVLVAIGLVFAGGTYAATLAVGKAPTAIVAPVAYLAVVFAMVIDLTVFQDPPDVLGLIGAAVVVAGGTWAILASRSTPPASTSPGGPQPDAPKEAPAGLPLDARTG